MKTLISTLAALAVVVGFGALGCDEGIYGGGAGADGAAANGADPYDGACHFEIVNATGEDVLALYVADAADASWGADMLDDDVLWDGDAMTGYLRPNPGSSYDLKAVGASATYEIADFVTCEGGEDLSFEIAPDEAPAGGKPGGGEECGEGSCEE